MKAKLQRKVIKLTSAWFDFDMTEKIVAETLSHFGEMNHEEAKMAFLHQDPTFFSLQMACVVSYARPFTSNEGLGALAGKLAKYHNAAQQQLHSDLITLRNKFFAHNDIEFRTITVIPILGQVLTEQDDRFSLGASSIMLSWDQFSIIREMCVNRKTILWPQLQKILNQIYPNTGEPYIPIPLNLEALGKVKF
jgi:hypothetical protein